MTVITIFNLNVIFYFLLLCLLSRPHSFRTSLIFQKSVNNKQFIFFTLTNNAISSLLRVLCHSLLLPRIKHQDQLLALRHVSDVRTRIRGDISSIQTLVRNEAKPTLQTYEDIVNGRAAELHYPWMVRIKLFSRYCEDHS